MKTWVLVADESRARIFMVNSLSGALKEHDSLVHMGPQQSKRDLLNTVPGRNRNQMFSVEASHDVRKTGAIHTRHALQFAKEIATKLRKSRDRNQYSDLILIAAPKFLRVLRKELDAQSKKLVSLELAKDLSKLSAQDIRSHLPKFLPANKH